MSKHCHFTSRDWNFPTVKWKGRIDFNVQVEGAVGGVDDLPHSIRPTVKHEIYTRNRRGMKKSLRVHKKVRKKKNLLSPLGWRKKWNTSVYEWMNIIISRCVRLLIMWRKFSFVAFALKWFKNAGRKHTTTEQHFLPGADFSSKRKLIPTMQFTIFLIMPFFRKPSPSLT